MKWLELKIPPLLVTLFFGALIWLMPTQKNNFNSNAIYIASYILFFVGSLISFLGVWEFKKHKTTVNPMKLQDSNSLVTKGVYNITRNPMYLGFLLWLISFGILMGNSFLFIPIFGFVLYMNKFQIAPEESVLEKKFGEEYQIYKKSVRRWI